MHTHTCILKIYECFGKKESYFFRGGGGILFLSKNKKTPPKKSTLFILKEKFDLIKNVWDESNGKKDVIFLGGYFIFV